MLLNPGAVIAGRYEIIEKIGAGGMANVYRAKDLELDRSVTFKVMKEEFANDEEFKARFKTEARSAAGLSNQNIVSIFDVGQEGDINYIVMEYINGLTLKDLIVRRGNFDNDEVLGVATQIAAGLKHAHEHGIIHRDIKPQNILVTSTGIIKVADFGIARAVSAATVTMSGNTMGSVHYFSPEQARGGHVDFKSDIYCLGIVMYEMITGKLPFEGDTPVAIALKQISDPLPNIREFNPKASDNVIGIIHKATAKLSKDRYQSTDELVSDLKRALAYQQNGIAKSVATPKTADDSKLLLNEEDAENQDVRNVSNTTGEVQHKRKPREITPSESRYAKFENKYDTYGGKNEEDEVDKKAERRIIIAAILTSIAIVSVAIAIATHFIMNSVPPTPQELDVPQFVGITTEQAEEFATAMGIRINIIRHEFSEEFDGGVIIYQSVANGGALYPGGAINVVVSQGDDRYEIPSLVNLDINDVEDIVRESVFTFTEEFVPSDTFAMNIVFEQYPLAGSMAHSGASIHVTISSGPSQSTAVVPNVVGFTEERAITEIQDARLVVNVVSRTENPAIPEGNVISQTIEAGEEVSVYTTVGLVVSTGPEDTAQPTPPPTPTPTPPQVSSIPMMLPHGAVPAEIDVINLRITRMVDGAGVLEYDENIQVSAFPFGLRRQGEGVVDFFVEILHPVTGELYHDFNYQLNFGS
ncbi:MAG: Stk1 family PASTA domain-containing Ser/Thr kinase [Defluviitaleaceae bacterium]|nr:Stk1 family PASTA domain-containing Ser/Thr kinase [Defluviitaleaceae bacterium]